MSVSLAVAAKHPYVASLGAPGEALPPAPWGAQTAPEDGDGFALTGTVMHFPPTGRSTPRETRRVPSTRWSVAWCGLAGS